MLRCTQDYQHFVPYSTDAGSALDRGFLGMGDPQVSMGFNTKIVQFWMIWGYQHVRKPPHPRNLIRGICVHPWILGGLSALDGEASSLIFQLRFWAVVTYGDGSNTIIIIYYHLLGNKHPLTSHMRVPFGCQGFDS